jgi:hypothetical protein
VPLRLGADVKAADVLQPDQRNAVAVARAAERADLRDPLSIEDPGRALLFAGLGVVDQSLPVEHETRVQAADTGDAADHLATDRRQDFPKKALVAEAREDLCRIVGLAMVDWKQARELRGRVGGLHRLDATPVERCTGAREPRHLAPEAVDQGFVVRDALIGATRLMHVHLGPANVERGDVLALGAFDQRRTRDHHVRLLGHVHAIADDRHVSTAGDAVTKHTRNLRHAFGRQQAVHLEDVTGTRGTGEAFALLR